MSTQPYSAEQMAMDIDDCLQFPEQIFSSETVGRQWDIAFTPIGANKDWEFLLRTCAKHEYGKPEASFELMSKKYFSPDMQMIMGYHVGSAGELESYRESVPHLGKLALHKPVLFDAPEMTKCIENFIDAENETEIDPAQLLDELMDFRITRSGTSHSSIRSVKDYYKDEYLVAIYNKRLELPDTLQLLADAPYRSAELISVAAEYQGKLILKSSIIVDKDADTVFAGALDDPALKNIAQTARFKRALFN